MQRVTRIFYAYLRITQILTQQMHVPVGSSSLNFQQVLLLSLLDREGPMTVGSLAHLTCIANSTLSGMIRQLEEMGLLRRQRAQEDHRVFYLEVTEAYHTLRQETSQEIDEELIRKLAPLSAAEQDELLLALERLEQALRSTPDWTP